MATEGNAKLLLVDDNPAQRTALAAILADLDVTLVEAASGREALRCLLHDEFAVILLDVNMPGLDGFETAALVRQRRSSEHTPIIFVTAYGDDAHASRGYSLGAVDYILSPVQADVLRTKVSVFIDLFKKTQLLTQQREALARYAAQLQQLTRASLAIHSATSVEAVLEIVTDNAAEIIGAHQASSSAALNDAVTVATAVRVSEKYGGLRTVRTANSPAHAWTGIDDSLRLSQAELDANATNGLSPPSIFRGLPMNGWLAAPLTGRDGRITGLAQLSDKDGGEFSAEDEGILVQLAQMASIAIENILTGEAREANRLKDEFLGVLSHELRTPLQAMLTWISILREDAVDRTVRTRGLDVIERSAKTQTQLIEDLLDVSRIIRGQMHLETGPVELGKVIGLAIETLKPGAIAKNIQIGWQPPVGDYKIIGDANRLQQIVWNLVSNAVKFTPDGGRVDVTLARSTTKVSIEVRDTGCGIPAQFLPHVFERFRQADSTTRRHHGGLGLGLAIVRHLAELHGGTARADNAPGGGAVFTITLPYQGEPADALAVTPVPGDGPGRGLAALSASGIRLDGIHVMVVEDETDARECLAATLQFYGAEVVAVGSVSAALVALEKYWPDVLLSDVAMAGEDGYSLIRKVRERETQHGSRLPAAALTAYVRPEDRAGALLAGFDTHASKPIHPLELARLVERLAGRTAHQ